MLLCALRSDSQDDVCWDGVVFVAKFGLLNSKWAPEDSASRSFKLCALWILSGVSEPGFAFGCRDLQSIPFCSLFVVAFALDW
jgi:hypothetical protein